MAKLSTKSMQIEDENGLKAYQCPACPRIFKKPQAVGTHMSRKHPDKYRELTGSEPGQHSKKHKGYKVRAKQQEQVTSQENESMPDLQYCPGCGLNLHFVRAGLSLAYKQRKG